MNRKSVNVDISEMDPETVAYIRHIGPYAGDEALFGRLYGQLCRWAGPRGLISDKAKFISVYHDNPEITDENRLRVSICLCVPGGTSAVGHFELNVFKPALSHRCHSTIDVRFTTLESRH